MAGLGDTLLDPIHLNDPEHEVEESPRHGDICFKTPKKSETPTGRSYSVRRDDPPSLSSLVIRTASKDRTVSNPACESITKDREERASATWTNIPNANRSNRHPRKELTQCTVLGCPVRGLSRNDMFQHSREHRTRFFGKKEEFVTIPELSERDNRVKATVKDARDLMSRSCLLLRVEMDQELNSSIHTKAAFRMTAWIISWIDKWLNFNLNGSSDELEDRGDQDQSPQEGSHAANRSISSVNAVSRTNAGAKRKSSGGLGGSGDDNEFDSEDEEGPKRLRLAEDPKLRFACPFFKHDRQAFLNDRTCIGPGWSTVRRVKEHVYRRHSLPRHQCKRCCGSFEDEESLEDHQTSPISCSVNAFRSKGEGITAAQEKLLRCRKRAHTSKPERDKWFDMYRIIFPREKNLSNLSPYYDNVPANTLSGTPDTQDFDAVSFIEYKKYLQRELPVDIRENLSRALETLVGKTDASTKECLINVFRETQVKLLDSFVAGTSDIEDPYTGASSSLSSTDDTFLFDSLLEPIESHEFSQLQDMQVGSDRNVPDPRTRAFQEAQPFDLSDDCIDLGGEASENSWWQSCFPESSSAKLALDFYPWKPLTSPSSENTPPLSTQQPFSINLPFS